MPLEGMEGLYQNSLQQQQQQHHHQQQRHSLLVLAVDNHAGPDLCCQLCPTIVAGLIDLLVIYPPRRVL
jgi:hypothetical protein